MTDKIQKIWEKHQRDLNLDTFRENNELHPDFWDDFSLKNDIKERLIKIATEYFEGLELEGVEIDDITFTGSLANLNWSKFSDIDLHILVDFNDVDENKDLVGEYFRAKSSLWNKNHNILIKNYEVEIYVQDTNEPHHSTGVYSIKNSEWIARPEKRNAKFDEEMVKKKSESLMDQIDRAHDLFDDKEYLQSYDYADKLKKKIRKFRQSGLETGGEYSAENISFKVLRRNGYLGLLSDLKTMSYDKMMSIGSNLSKKFAIFVKKPKKNESRGFNRLYEESKFQKRVKAKHSRLKKANIGGGNQNPGPPYNKKPSYKRAKSSPPGFGGS